MRRIAILLPLLLSACGGHAGNYLIEASPAWEVPTPTPVPPKAKKAKGTPTPALTPTPEVLKVFLAPFKDRRRNREIYRGRASYENVRVDVAGRTLLAKAWQDLYPGDISFLWHRELSAALGGSGYRLSAAAEPLSDEDALKAAREAGADYLLRGDIRKLGITKKGADPLLGTNFGGTNYTFYSLHEVTLQSLSRGSKIEGEIGHERIYFNNVSLGAPNRDTFPQYFVRGLSTLR